MEKEKDRALCVLAIGDSISSDGRWQKEFSRVTGFEVATHARGGIGIIDMVFGLGAAEADGMKYDPTTGVNGELPPLTVSDVAECDVIIFLGGYNERHMEYGGEDDVYPAQNTLNGKLNVVIRRILELLDKAGNSECRLILVSPHCVGRYDWVDADGTEEFPAGSGRTLETMSEVIAGAAKRFSLPFFDAYHKSGIGRENWNIYAASASPLSQDYDPEKEYSAPYPQYADQAHLNGAGYAKLGGEIARFVLDKYDK